MATLAEIRAQYPQYADMPDTALADALHRKFYADIPRADFDVKIGLIKGPIKKLYRLGGLINDGFSPIISSG